MLGPAFGNLAIVLIGVALLVVAFVFFYPALVALGARFGFWAERQESAADRAVEEERRRHEFLREEQKWREEHKR